jgi:D-alanyl-D-alanine carboxypeptidase/D-alanyl-D-alanine-endopeptidase (penicillin-binding protein 4)
VRALCAVVAAALAAAGAASGADVAPLADRLGSVLRTDPLRGARLGILVVREEDGKVLFQRDPDRPLVPASNMKVMTAIAALSAFGPAHSFETRVLASAPPDGEGTVPGIAVVGGGDPVMNSEDWWRLAADLHRAGLRRVAGDVVVDDSLFDRELWHPSWSGVSARAYHAPVGALTANYGAFFISVEPGESKGEPVRVAVDPPIDYLRIANLATTGDADVRRTLSVHRNQAGDGVELIQVRGTLRSGDERDVFPRSVRDPALYAGHVFVMQLGAVGIEVEGRVRRAKAEHAHVLTTHSGRPLAEIVRLFMKYSNNSIAESLVKSLAVHAGATPGSWPAGLRALRTELEGLGLLGPGAMLVDGSGLSAVNRLSARMLVDALRTGSASFRIGPELVAALPIAQRDGTLERRGEASADRVRAKTGLLSDQRVTALSGFAELPGGGRAVFSILVNGHRGGSQAAMDAVDRFVAELTR